MNTPLLLFIIAGIGIFLTPFFYGSDHAMDDPIHFLFHGWGIVIVAVAFYYRTKIEKVK